jgi:DNA-binding GntR family transcriptional regulator
VRLPEVGPGRYWLRDYDAPTHVSTAEALLGVFHVVGDAEAERRFRLHFELHVYATLLSRGRRELADRYLASSPVREAIRSLEHEGVLEQVPRYGTIVRRAERSDLVELYELREAVEPFAVAKAALAVLPEDLISLRRLCDEIGMLIRELKKSKLLLLDAAQMQRLLSADLGFHLLLLRAAGNQRMMKIVSESRLLTGIFGTQRQAHTIAVLQQTHQDHLAILEAVESGNAKAASRDMLDHIRKSKQQALDAYDRERSAPNPRLIPLTMPQQLLAEVHRIEKRRK